MAGEALKKYRESLTDEQKKEMAQKGALTRRKNKFEERQMEQKIRAGLQIILNVPEKDEEGNQKLDKNLKPIINKKSFLEVGIENLLNRLIKEETSTNELVKAFEFVRDTTEGKPTTKVDLDANVTTTVEELLKNVEGENKY
jgi:hypothetical protein